MNHFPENHFIRTLKNIQTSPIEFGNIYKLDGKNILIFNLDQSTDESRLLNEFSKNQINVKNIFFILCTFENETYWRRSNFLKDKKFFIDFITQACNGKIINYLDLPIFLDKLESANFEKQYLKKSNNSLYLILQTLTGKNSMFYKTFGDTYYQKIRDSINNIDIPKDIICALSNSYQKGADVLAHSLGHKYEEEFKGFKKDTLMVQECVKKFKIAQKENNNNKKKKNKRINLKFGSEKIQQLGMTFDNLLQFKKDEAAKILNSMLVDLSLNICANPFDFKPIKERKIARDVILFIDDKLNTDYFKEYLKILKRYLPKWNFFGLFNYREFIKFGSDLNSEAFEQINWKEKFQIKFFNNDKWIENEIEFNPRAIQFACIDLLYGNDLLGFEILRIIRQINLWRDHFLHTIVLSRSSRSEYIQASLNEGALAFINKENFLQISAILPSVEIPSIEKVRFYNKFENWHRLSKLPPKKIFELQSSGIKGEEYNPFAKEDDELWINLENSEDYKWIQKLPKADIHCHLGSCMDPELLPKTALLVLSEMFNKSKLKDKKIENILRFLFPIVLDPYLGRKFQTRPAKIKPNTDLKNYRDTFNVSNTPVAFCLFDILNSEFPLKENMLKPEEVLLSPEDTTLERMSFSEKIESSSYFERKFVLRKQDVKYDVTMLFFILLIYLRDSKDLKLSQIKNILKEFEDVLGKIDSHTKIEINPFCKELLSTLDNNFSNELEELEKMPTANILAFLQSAHSIDRCLKNKGLFNYLRGCEYGGSAHLQTKAALYLTAKNVIEEYAIRDNIRYLELRCAVDGYSKLKLQSQEEALEALLRGFDFFCKEYKNKETKIHVNLIITAKRHKSEEAFENNIRLGLNYRNGLQLNIEREKKKKEKQKIVSFFNTKSKVVSFDLAGLEKGNRPSKFLTQFMKLLKECFPITIHAGEEDDFESIWEAVYLVHSQRLGHALTLRDNINLLNIVRERHIAVELCPISNILTNPVFKFPTDESDNWDPKDKSAYPLRQYLDQNLDVTLNTDNPYISDTFITKEYLVAARLIRGLSKWEILRLLKNSFRSAAVPKDEKRMLMNEIDEEIYNILLNE